MKRLFLGLVMVLASGVLVAQAQVASCDASGRQVVARRWDVVLGHQWEMVRDCRHPDWPARARSVRDLLGNVPAGAGTQAEAVQTQVQAKQPFIVRAGDTIRLWQQAAYLRMEMSGVAEQAARRGDRIPVRVTRQNDDGSTSTARIFGIVRATGNVEMDQ